MTMPTDVVAELTWEPPGPGTWMLAADHYPRPVTAALADDLSVWGEATTAYMHDLGIPIALARMEAVNGLPYVSMVPEGRQGAKPPPAWVFRVAVRVVPSLRRSERRLAQLLQDRPWNDGIRRWYEVQRPAATARMSALAAVDPHGLDDDALVVHLGVCHQEVVGSLREHLAMHAHDTLAPALFALRLVDWGLAATDAWDLLAGSSPASTGASPELDALRAAVAGRSAADTEGLRALGPDVAAALDDFLERHGWRLLDGYDVDGRCLAEAPSIVVALATAPPAPVVDQTEALERVRATVPADDRPELDRLVEEARAAYGLRDDNSAVLTAWPVGLLRRAMLAAGRRLAERGALTDPSQAIEAAIVELQGALDASTPLDGDELERRALARRSLRAADAPRTLGPPEPPIPTDLPGALGTVMRALALVAPSAGPEPEGPAVATRPDGALVGLGIGTSAHRGRARLVLGGHAADELQPGEVLVAPMTSPSYNLLISLASALVTEEGDDVSHAAIMARELGLPAVIGAPGATTEIRDGDLVEVDPAAGEVRIIKRATTS